MEEDERIFVESRRVNKGVASGYRRVGGIESNRTRIDLLCYKLFIIINLC